MRQHETEGRSRSPLAGSTGRGGMLLAVALALAPAVAAPADVAVLKSSEVPAWRPTLDAIKRSAAGHTVREYDLRNDRAEADRVLNELKAGKPIVIAVGELAAQAAHQVAPELPLIYCMVLDPGKLGLTGVAGTTGVAFTLPVKNQLAAFRSVNPRAVRIGVIYNAENTGKQVEDAQKAAPVVRLTIVDRPVASDKDVPQALRSLLTGSDAVDALYLPPDRMLLGDDTRRFIFAEALKAGKPVYAFASYWMSEGVLVANSPDFASIGEQAGELVNRIAAGDKKLDVLIPRAELSINKKIADKLKIDIPPEALKGAKVF